MNTLSMLIVKLGAYTTRKGGEELVFKCPRCKRSKMEVNLRRRVFNCFRCNFGGDISKLYTALKIPEEFGHVLELGKKRSAPVKESLLKEIEVPPFKAPLTVEMVNYLDSRGVSLARAQAMQVYKSNGFRFRNRIIIPIFEEGKIVCYVARALFPNMPPKEMGPPADISNKSHFIYNIDSIESGDGIIVVEGIFDCEAVLRRNFKCVSILGSNLSDIQAGKLLAKRPKSITFMLDGDPAGVKGMAAAFIKLSKRNYRNVNLVKLPENVDPDELNEVQLNNALLGL